MAKRVHDAQRPLPFKLGLPAARRRPARTWRTPGGERARVCPVCACDEHRRCTVRLADGAGEAACVPAGVHGQRVCSACKQTKLFD